MSDIYPPIKLINKGLSIFQKLQVQYNSVKVIFFLLTEN